MGAGSGIESERVDYKEASITMMGAAVNVGLSDKRYLAGIGGNLEQFV